jgi:uncharacterized protein (TIGR02145 family)
MRIWKAHLILLALFCVVAFAQQKGTFTDVRDGKTYKTVKIVNLIWMAENLNYQTSSGSWCYTNCNKYGRLYDWKAANSACPSDWHLPTSNEWDNLAATVGGKRDSVNNKHGQTVYYWKPSGKKLKSKIGWNWDDDNKRTGNGTDEFGFSALPGGIRSTDGSFGLVGNYGYWWTATEFDSGNAYYQRMFYDFEGVSEGYDGKSDGFSVRCVQN